MTQQGDAQPEQERDPVISDASPGPEAGAREDTRPADIKAEGDRAVAIVSAAADGRIQAPQTTTAKTDSTSWKPEEINDPKKYLDRLLPEQGLSQQAKELKATMARILDHAIKQGWKPEAGKSTMPWPSQEGRETVLRPTDLRSILRSAVRSGVQLPPALDRDVKAATNDNGTLKPEYQNRRIEPNDEVARLRANPSLPRLDATGFGGRDAKGKPDTNLSSYLERLIPGEGNKQIRENIEKGLRALMDASGQRGENPLPGQHKFGPKGQEVDINALLFNVYGNNFDKMPKSVADAVKAYKERTAATIPGDRSAGPRPGEQSAEAQLKMFQQVENLWKNKDARRALSNELFGIKSGKGAADLLDRLEKAGMIAPGTSPAAKRQFIKDFMQANREAGHGNSLVTGQTFAGKPPGKTVSIYDFVRDSWKAQNKEVPAGVEQAIQQSMERTRTGSGTGRTQIPGSGRAEQDPRPGDPPRLPAGQSYVQRPEAETRGELVRRTPDGPVEVAANKFDTSRVTKLNDKELAEYTRKIYEQVPNSTLGRIFSSVKMEDLERQLGSLSKADRDKVREQYKTLSGGRSLEDNIRDYYGGLISGPGEKTPEFQKIKTILDREDHQPNIAGAIGEGLALLERNRSSVRSSDWKSDQKRAEEQITKAVLGVRNERDMAKLGEDLAKRYPEFFGQNITGPEALKKLTQLQGLSPEVQKALDMAINTQPPGKPRGIENRTAQQQAEIAKLAIEKGNLDLLRQMVQSQEKDFFEAPGGRSIPTLQRQTRDLLARDPQLLKTIENSFGHWYSSTEARIAKDLVQNGYASLDTVTHANQGLTKWAFGVGGLLNFGQNKDVIAQAAERIPEHVRAQLNDGFLASKKPPGSRLTDSEKANLERYNSAIEAFKKAGTDRDVAIWQDLLLNGRRTSISTLAETHDTSWHGLGRQWHNKDEFMRVLDHKMPDKDITDILADPKKYAAYRAQVAEVLTNLTNNKDSDGRPKPDPGEVKAIMTLLDRRALAAQDAAKAPGSTPESIIKAAKQVHLSAADLIRGGLQSGTFWDGSKITEANAGAVLNGLANTRGGDFGRSPSEIQATRTALEQAIQKFPEQWQKQYATELLTRVGQLRAGEQLPLTAKDRIILNSLNGSTSSEKLKAIEEGLQSKNPAEAKALKDILNADISRLSGIDLRVRQAVEKAAWDAVGTTTALGYQFGLDNRYSRIMDALKTTGRIAPAEKIAVGYPHKDVYAEMADPRKTTPEQYQAGRSALSSSERSIMDDARRNGSLTLTHKILLMTRTAESGYTFQDFKEDFRKLPNNEKQAFKEDFLRTTARLDGGKGQTVEEVFLPKVPPSEQVTFKQLLTPGRDTTGWQSLFDSMRKINEESTGFSLSGTFNFDNSAVFRDQMAGAFNAALNEYGARGQKLSPDQQDKLLTAVGKSLETFMTSRDYTGDTAKATAAFAAKMIVTIGAFMLATVGTVGSGGAGAASYAGAFALAAKLFAVGAGLHVAEQLAFHKSLEQFLYHLDESLLETGAVGVTSIIGGGSAAAARQAFLQAAKVNVVKAEAQNLVAQKVGGEAAKAFSAELEKATAKGFNPVEYARATEKLLEEASKKLPQAEYEALKKQLELQGQSLVQANVSIQQSMLQHQVTENVSNNVSRNLGSQFPAESQLIKELSLKIPSVFKADAAGSIDRVALKTLMEEAQQKGLSTAALKAFEQSVVSGFEKSGAGIASRYLQFAVRHEAGDVWLRNLALGAAIGFADQANAVLIQGGNFDAKAFLMSVGMGGAMGRFMHFAIPAASRGYHRLTAEVREQQVFVKGDGPIHYEYKGQKLVAKDGEFKLPEDWDHSRDRIVSTGKTTEPRDVVHAADPAGEHSSPPAEARPLEPGAKPPEPGAKPPEPGAKPPEPGAKPPEPGARQPEPGARQPEPGTTISADATATVHAASIHSTPPAGTQAHPPGAGKAESPVVSRRPVEPRLTAAADGPPAHLPEASRRPETVPPAGKEVPTVARAAAGDGAVVHPALRAHETTPVVRNHYDGTHTRVVTPAEVARGTSPLRVEQGRFTTHAEINRRVLGDANPNNVKLDYEIRYGKHSALKLNADGSTDLVTRSRNWLGKLKDNDPVRLTEAAERGGYHLALGEAAAIKQAAERGDGISVYAKNQKDVDRILKALSELKDNPLFKELGLDVHFQNLPGLLGSGAHAIGHKGQFEQPQEVFKVSLKKPKGKTEEETRLLYEEAQRNMVALLDDALRANGVRGNGEGVVGRVPHTRSGAIGHSNTTRERIILTPFKADGSPGANITAYRLSKHESNGINSDINNLAAITGDTRKAHRFVEQQLGLREGSLVKDKDGFWHIKQNDGSTLDGGRLLHAGEGDRRALNLLTQRHGIHESGIDPRTGKPWNEFLPAQEGPVFKLRAGAPTPNGDRQIPIAISKNNGNVIMAQSSGKSNAPIKLSSKEPTEIYIWSKNSPEPRLQILGAGSDVVLANGDLVLIKRPPTKDNPESGWLVLKNQQASQRLVEVDFMPGTSPMDQIDHAFKTMGGYTPNPNRTASSTDPAAGSHGTTTKPADPAAVTPSAKGADPTSVTAHSTAPTSGGNPTSVSALLPTKTAALEKATTAKTEAVKAKEAAEIALAAKERTYRDSTETYDQLRSEIETKKAELTKLERELAEATETNLKSTATGGDSIDTAALAQDIKARRTNIKSQEQALNEIKADLDKVNTQIREERTALEQLNRTAAQRTSEEGQLRNEVTKLTEFNERVHRLETEQARLTDQLAHLQEQEQALLRTTSEARDTQTQRLRETEQSIKRLDTELERLRQQHIENQHESFGDRWKGRRDYQEDNIFTSSDRNLIVLADGAGGQEGGGGAGASRIAIDKFSELYALKLSQEPNFFRTASKTQIQQWLQEATTEVNETVAKFQAFAAKTKGPKVYKSPVDGTEHAIGPKMASTLSIGLKHGPRGDDFTAAWLGDSPIFIHNQNGNIHKISVDHDTIHSKLRSLDAELKAARQSNDRARVQEISARIEETLNETANPLIAKALGGDERGSTLSFHSRKLVEGDDIIFASDGSNPIEGKVLDRRVDSAKDQYYDARLDGRGPLEQALRESREKGLNAEDTVNKLLSTSQQHADSHQDNVTFAMMRHRPAESAEARRIASIDNLTRQREALIAEKDRLTSSSTTTSEPPARSAYIVAIGNAKRELAAVESSLKAEGERVSKERAAIDKRQTELKEQDTALTVREQSLASEKAIHEREQAEFAAKKDSLAKDESDRISDTLSKKTTELEQRTAELTRERETLTEQHKELDQRRAINNNERIRLGENIEGNPSAAKPRVTEVPAESGRTASDTTSSRTANPGRTEERGLAAGWRRFREAISEAYRNTFERTIGTAKELTLKKGTGESNAAWLWRTSSGLAIALPVRLGSIGITHVIIPAGRGSLRAIGNILSHPVSWAGIGTRWSGSGLRNLSRDYIQNPGNIGRTFGQSKVADAFTRGNSMPIHHRVGNTVLGTGSFVLSGAAEASGAVLKKGFSAVNKTGEFLEGTSRVLSGQTRLRDGLSEALTGLKSTVKAERMAEATRRIREIPNDFHSRAKLRELPYNIGEALAKYAQIAASFGRTLTGALGYTSRTLTRWNWRTHGDRAVVEGHLEIPTASEHAQILTPKQQRQWAERQDLTPFLQTLERNTFNTRDMAAAQNALVGDTARAAQIVNQELAKVVKSLVEMGITDPRVIHATLRRSIKHYQAETGIGLRQSYLPYRVKLEGNEIKLIRIASTSSEAASAAQTSAPSRVNTIRPFELGNLSTLAPGTWHSVEVNGGVKLNFRTDKDGKLIVQRNENVQVKDKDGKLITPLPHGEDGSTALHFKVPAKEDGSIHSIFVKGSDGQTHEIFLNWTRPTEASPPKSTSRSAFEPDSINTVSFGGVKNQPIPNNGTAAILGSGPSGTGMVQVRKSNTTSGDRAHPHPEVEVVASPGHQLYVLRAGKTNFEKPFESGQAVIIQPGDKAYVVNPNETLGKTIAEKLAKGKELKPAEESFSRLHFETAAKERIEPLPLSNGRRNDLHLTSQSLVGADGASIKGSAKSNILAAVETSPSPRITVERTVKQADGTVVKQIHEVKGRDQIPALLHGDEVRIGNNSFTVKQGNRPLQRDLDRSSTSASRDKSSTSASRDRSSTNTDRDRPGFFARSFRLIGINVPFVSRHIVDFGNKLIRVGQRTEIILKGNMPYVSANKNERPRLRVNGNDLVIRHNDNARPVFIQRKGTVGWEKIEAGVVGRAHPGDQIKLGSIDDKAPTTVWNPERRSSTLRAGERSRYKQNVETEGANTKSGQAVHVDGRHYIVTPGKPVLIGTPKVDGLSRQSSAFIKAETQPGARRWFGKDQDTHSNWIHNPEHTSSPAEQVWVRFRGTDRLVEIKPGSKQQLGHGDDVFVGEPGNRKLVYSERTTAYNTNDVQLHVNGKPIPDTVTDGRTALAIGRHSSNPVGHSTDSTMSDHHALFIRTKDAQGQEVWAVKDRGSQNGTEIKINYRDENGHIQERKIVLRGQTDKDAYIIQPGQQVTIGNQVFKLEYRNIGLHRTTAEGQTGTQLRLPVKFGERSIVGKEGFKLPGTHDKNYAEFTASADGIVVKATAPQGIWITRPHSQPEHIKQGEQRLLNMGDKNTPADQIRFRKNGPDYALIRPSVAGAPEVVEATRMATRSWNRGTREAARELRGTSNDFHQKGVLSGEIPENLPIASTRHDGRNLVNKKGATSPGDGIVLVADRGQRVQEVIQDSGTGFSHLRKEHSSSNFVRVLEGLMNHVHNTLTPPNMLPGQVRQRQIELRNQGTHELTLSELINRTRNNQLGGNARDKAVLLKILADHHLGSLPEGTSIDATLVRGFVKPEGHTGPIPGHDNHFYVEVTIKTDGETRKIILDPARKRVVEGEHITIMDKEDGHQMIKGASREWDRYVASRGKEAQSAKDTNFYKGQEVNYKSPSILPFRSIDRGYQVVEGTQSTGIFGRRTVQIQKYSYHNVAPHELPKAVGSLKVDSVYEFRPGQKGVFKGRTDTGHYVFGRVVEARVVGAKRLARLNRDRGTELHVTPETAPLTERAGERAVTKTGPKPKPGDDPAATTGRDTPAARPSEPVRSDANSARAELLKAGISSDALSGIIAVPRGDKIPRLIDAKSAAKVQKAVDAKTRELARDFKQANKRGDLAAAQDALNQTAEILTANYRLQASRLQENPPHWAKDEASLQRQVAEDLASKFENRSRRSTKKEAITASENADGSRTFTLNRVQTGKQQWTISRWPGRKAPEHNNQPAFVTFRDGKPEVKFGNPTTGDGAAAARPATTARPPAETEAARAAIARRHTEVLKHETSSLEHIVHQNNSQAEISELAARKLLPTNRKGDVVTGVTQVDGNRWQLNAKEDAVRLQTRTDQALRDLAVKYEAASTGLNRQLLLDQAAALVTLQQRLLANGTRTKYEDGGLKPFGPDQLLNNVATALDKHFGNSRHHRSSTTAEPSATSGSGASATERPKVKYDTDARGNRRFYFGDKPGDAVTTTHSSSPEHTRVADGPDHTTSARPPRMESLSRTAEGRHRDTATPQEHPNARAKAEEGNLAEIDTQAIVLVVGEHGHGGAAFHAVTGKEYFTPELAHGLTRADGTPLIPHGTRDNTARLEPGEVYKITRSREGLPNQDVFIVTQGYELKGKSVETLTLNTLKSAHENGKTEIALPLIGAGTAGGSVENAIEGIISAIKQFRTNPETANSPLNIRVVAFPGRPGDTAAATLARAQVARINEALRNLDSELARARNPEATAPSRVARPGIERTSSPHTETRTLTEAGIPFEGANAERGYSARRINQEPQRYEDGGPHWTGQDTLSGRTTIEETRQIQYGTTRHENGGKEFPLAISEHSDGSSLRYVEDTVRENRTERTISRIDEYNSAGNDRPRNRWEHIPDLKDPKAEGQWNRYAHDDATGGTWHFSNDGQRAKMEVDLIIRAQESDGIHINHIDKLEISIEPGAKNPNDPTQIGFSVRAKSAHLTEGGIGPLWFPADTKVIEIGKPVRTLHDISPSAVFLSANHTTVNPTGDGRATGLIQLRLPEFGIKEPPQAVKDLDARMKPERDARVKAEAERAEASERNRAILEVPDRPATTTKPAELLRSNIGSDYTSLGENIGAKLDEIMQATTAAQKSRTSTIDHQTTAIPESAIGSIKEKFDVILATLSAHANLPEAQMTAIQEAANSIPGIQLKWQRLSESNSPHRTHPDAQNLHYPELTVQTDKGDVTLAPQSKLHEDKVRMALTSTIQDATTAAAHNGTTSNARAGFKVEDSSIPLELADGSDLAKLAARAKEVAPLSHDGREQSKGSVTKDLRSVIYSYEDGSFITLGIGNKHLEYEPPEQAIKTQDRIARETAQQSGYPYNTPDSSTIGWKLHIDVPADRDTPLSREISLYLQRQGIKHKIGSGGDDASGSGITIYTGNRDLNLRIADEINTQFGNRIRSGKDNPGKDAIDIGDQFIYQGISTRFGIPLDTKLGDEFLQASMQGIGVPLRREYRDTVHLPNSPDRARATTRARRPIEEEIAALRQSATELTERYGAFYAGTRIYRQGNSPEQAILNAAQELETIWRISNQARAAEKKT